MKSQDGFSVPLPDFSIRPEAVVNACAPFEHARVKLVTHVLASYLDYIRTHREFDENSTPWNPGALAKQGRNPITGWTALTCLDLARRTVHLLRIARALASTVVNRAAAIIGANGCCSIELSAKVERIGVAFAITPMDLGSPCLRA